MRLWQGVLVSVLFHAGLFFIPVAGNIPEERPREDLEFVIVQEAREGSVSEEEQGPEPADGQPRGPSAQPMPEPTLQPEEPMDPPQVEQVENEPPVPEDKPAPTMLAREVPKPPQPIKKPQRRPTRPPRPERPAKAQPRPETVSDDAVPSVQPSAHQPGPESGQGEDASQHAALHSSTPGGGGSSAHGPVDSSFGSGDGPRFVRKALPNYPRLARELGKEGTVLLRLTIDERGRLMDIEVVKPAGSGFDEEAVRAVKSSTFCPARKGGKPVMCRAQLPIRFVLRSTEND